MAGQEVKFNIKHAGKIYPMTITSATTVGELKSMVQDITKVPMSRQKYMVKGGLNVGDEASNLDTVFQNGSTVMVLGTPDANLISKPKQNSNFIEDLAPDQQMQQFNENPIGFKNMGNTCYLNATLQALYRIEPLRNMILEYKNDGASDQGIEMHHKIVVEMQRAFQNLSNKTYTSVMPVVLLNVLRKCYPQFAEMDQQHGCYKQQDAEELFTQLFHSFTVVFGEQFTNDFEIGFKTTIKDSANEVDVQVKEENDVKLQCHISGTTNFMKNGLIESLHEEIEKRSEATGANSKFLVDKQITKLPKYLTVQYVRFFWKRSTNKKSKILRKVQFPFQLDVADMLTPEYAQEKINVREELRKVEKEKVDAEREAKRRKVDSDDSTAVMTPREKYETELALKKSENEKWASEYKKHFPSELKPGENPSSVYNLIGVITHQGANSESGHYQSFIRDDTDEDRWYKFDDDKVSVVDKEKIEALAGGGESDSALILIYKGLGL